MTTDGANITTEDAEMECDGDKVVTMLDVLQEQQDFEEDANAVLGASDDKNCTYPKGYIKRQALYACLTCCNEAKTDPTKRAGVCLACSLNCHENHELIELYTKRNFRCDCGNPKFNSHPCTFTQDKADLNNDNIYNQNFSGLYCTCQRPYPDPESTIEDDMIQCIICEDWLHASHLESVVPANDQYAEMVCKACMENNEFLHDYTSFAVNVETEDVDAITMNGDAKSSDNNLNSGNLINGVEENQTGCDKPNVTANGDVEMNDNNEKREKIVEDGPESETNHIISSEVSMETNQNDSSYVDSTESKSDSVHGSKTDLETDSSKTEDEKYINTETNAASKNDDSLDTTEDSNKNDKDISSALTELHTDEKVVTSDEKTENKVQSTENESEKTQENLKVNEDIGKDMQQTSTDLKTAENPTSELNNDLATDDKLIESAKQSENSKNKDIQINNEESSDEKILLEGKLNSSEVEVPDTSQPNNDKSDSVMDAIDELLQAGNETKDDISKEKKELTIEKETLNNVATTDVEMSSNENKYDNEEPQQSGDSAAVNDKTSNETKDIDMVDATAGNKPNKNKADDDLPMDSGSKDDKGTEISLNKTECSESPKDDNDKNEVTEIEHKEVHETLNTTDNEVTKTTEEDITSEKGSESKEPSSNEDTVPDVTDNSKEHKRKLSTDLTKDISSKKAKLECVRPKGVKRVYRGATFWPSNFRQKLCTCPECLAMYKDLKVMFLTDFEDTVFAYESLGKENVAGGASQYEKGLQALSSLDRIQQINALTEYNKMRDKLLDFLKSFKDRKEIVKEEDIKAFFAGMKPRREPDGVYFCR